MKLNHTHAPITLIKLGQPISQQKGVYNVTQNGLSVSALLWENCSPQKQFACLVSLDVSGPPFTNKERHAVSQCELILCSNTHTLIRSLSETGNEIVIIDSLFNRVL